MKRLTVFDDLLDCAVLASKSGSNSATIGNGQFRLSAKRCKPLGMSKMTDVNCFPFPVSGGAT